MVLLPRLLMTITFAAHALAGCCAHQGCHHGLAAIETSANRLHDGCAGDHRHKPHERTNEHEHPAPSCEHSTCSFVKVESAGVDQDERRAAWLAIVLPQLDAQLLASSLPSDAIPRGPLCATALYVWHCALLI